MRGGVDDVPGVPVTIRTQFAHAAVQYLAEHARVDILHIKGVATDPDLRTRPEGGTDADILVRPAHIDRLLVLLWRHGWRRETGFETGSAWGHATTASHPHFGYADVHRFFPGLGADPERNFETLWRNRATSTIATVPCPVPDRRAQVLIRVLNAARSNRRLWTRQEIAGMLANEGWAPFERLVKELDAWTGLDAALGLLEHHRGSPEYGLWKIDLHGGSRSEEWVARLRYARTPGARVRLLVRAPLANPDNLRITLGRPPTRAELVSATVTRWRRATQELVRRSRGVDQP